MLDIQKPERAPQGPEQERPAPQREELALPFSGRLKSFDFVGFHRGPISRSRRQIQGWSLMAIVIDQLVSFVVASIFLVAFSLASGMKFSELGLILGGLSAEVALLSGIMGLSFFYFLVLRAFFGFTVGEWACNLRMGTLEQRFEKFYLLRVMARSLLIFGTGLIFVPLLSVLLGEDLLEKVTGLKLTSIS